MGVIENPPAFPTIGNVAYNSEWDTEHGMTLRDWFAGRALPAIISATSAGQHQPGVMGDDRSIQTRMAEDAYKLADAMLAARAVQS